MGTPDNPQGALKTAIEQKLLEQEAHNTRPRSDDDEVDRYITESRDSKTTSPTNNCASSLQTQNLSYDDFRAKIRKQVEAMTMIDHEVRQKIVIPEAEIENYYKNNPDEFTTSEEKFKLAQILIAVPADTHAATHRGVAPEGRRRTQASGQERRRLRQLSHCNIPTTIRKPKAANSANSRPATSMTPCSQRSETRRTAISRRSSKPSTASISSRSKSTNCRE